MRIKIYALIGIVLLCYSCKKEHRSDTVSPTYDVHFTVGSSGNAFIQASRNLSSAAPAAVLNNLIYLVYNSSGQLIHQIKQSSTTTGFGTFNDNLPPGTYHVLFIGNGTTNLNILPPNQGTYGTDIFSVVPGADIFYKNDTVTVSNSQINQNVTLGRLTSQIRIKSTNDVPIQIDSVIVKISDNSAFLCATGASSAATNSAYTKKIVHAFTAAEHGTSNFQLSSYVYNTATPVSLSITQYYQGKASTPIIVNNITCKPNTITLLTGKMFQPDPNTAASFQITFDPNWNVQTSTF